MVGPAKQSIRIKNSCGSRRRIRRPGAHRVELVLLPPQGRTACKIQLLATSVWSQPNGQANRALALEALYFSKVAQGESNG